jgi:radical SAM protein
VREETLTRALNRYDHSPHLVFWETTKACSLACRHCRASAQLDALPGELSTQAGFALIDQIADMPGPSPILVFTGGDCFAREDLAELIGYARSRGLRLGIAPSVTDRLTKEVLEDLYALGVRSVSISLDGASPASHDTLRGIPGHFDKTIDALHMMRDLGFRLQVNTTVMKHTAPEMAAIFSLLRETGVSIWEVFFLVGVGRGVQILEVEPAEAEDICHFLVDATAYGMTVRTVEAPFFRRVQAEREPYGPEDPRSHFDLGELYDDLRAGLDREEGANDHSIRGTTLATGDGRGIIFVGFDGEVHASGFLPLALGNVRTESLGDIYTSNPLLTTIRSGQFIGECGRCDYRRLCGGSRARAYARSGQVLGDDPSCIRTRAARRIPLPLT